MALANAKLVKAAAAVTAASGATAKVAACLAQVINAVGAEIGKTGALTPNQQNKITAMAADAAANTATFQTALGL